MVLANGTIVECSSTQRPDLFCAMLGAGSSFGIAVLYQFQTFEAPAEVTWFSAQLSWDRSTAVARLEALEDYARHTTPSELNMRLSGSRFSSCLEGVY